VRAIERASSDPTEVEQLALGLLSNFSAAYPKIRAASAALTVLSKFVGPAPGEKILRGHLRAITHQCVERVAAAARITTHDMAAGELSTDAGAL
jgi:hypothetical protein